MKPAFLGFSTIIEFDGETFINIYQGYPIVPLQFEINIKCNCALTAYQLHISVGKKDMEKWVKMFWGIHPLPLKIYVRHLLHFQIHQLFLWSGIMYRGGSMYLYYQIPSKYVPTIPIV